MNDLELLHHKREREIDRYSENLESHWRRDLISVVK